MSAPLSDLLWLQTRWEATPCSHLQTLGQLLCKKWAEPMEQPLQQERSQPNGSFPLVASQGVRKKALLLAEPEKKR